MPIVGDESNPVPPLIIHTGLGLDPGRGVLEMQLIGLRVPVR